VGSLIIMGLATFTIGATSGALAAKPTTTTTLPPAPSLGVPDVVTVDLTDPSTWTAVHEVNCPSGEVALSFSFAYINDATGELYNAGSTDHAERPVLTNGVPTGYQFQLANGQSGAHPRLHVTCAPINS